MHLAQLAQLAQETGAELLECILVTGELLVLDAARCWEEAVAARRVVPAASYRARMAAVAAALLAEQQRKQ
jgi:hypothetical protein